MEQQDNKPIQKKKLILDTNAFIQQINLKELNESYDLYTTNGVLGEIRDEQARQRLEFNRMIVDIKTAYPSESACKRVEDFAKKTGDFKSLSEVDLDVIALAVTFIETAKKTKLLNKEPQTVKEYKVKTETLEPLDQSIQEAKEQNSENIEDNDDGFVEVRSKRKNKQQFKQNANKNQIEQSKTEIVENQTNTQQETKQVTKQKKEVQEQQQSSQEINQETEQKQSETEVKKLEEPKQPNNEKEQNQSEQQEKSTEEKKNTADIDSDSDDDCDDEWITPQNVRQYLNNISDKKAEQLEDKENDLGVAITTTDYAMQNVILQMGLPLRSFDGKQITNIKTFVLECYACLYKCRNLDKDFCPQCGNKTLLKLTVQVNSDGSLICFRKKNFKVKQRGNIYPIPKFKGGQQQTELLLREDQFLIKGREFIKRDQERQKQKEFKKAEVNIQNGFGFDIIQPKKKQNRNLQYAYGRINPNDQHAMKSKKRGKK